MWTFLALSLTKLPGMTRDGHQLRTTEANGNAVLQLAAAKIKPEGVQWILSRAKVLFHYRNF